MSLINDALKRASEADRNRPAQAPVPRIMQPATEPQRRARNSSLVAAIAVTVAGFAVAGWFFWLSLATGHLPADAARQAQAPLAEPSTVTVAPKPAPAVQETTPPSSVPAPSVAAASASTVPAPAPVADAWLTNLTVKAIFYSKTSPRALVNGKTVGTGDKVDGVLVTGILPDRVFVDWNGQTREIMLGNQ